MKTLAYTLLLLVSASNIFAGPWFTHKAGIENGDKIDNIISSKERVYVFLRPSPSEKDRDRNTPVKILNANNTKTVTEVIKASTDIYPKDYPQEAFLMIYRNGKLTQVYYTGLIKNSDSTYNGKPYKQKLDFKIQPRDVIYIGYSI